jgi:hypothetical protein
MTKEEMREQISRERRRLADFITSHPSRFYICEGCESICDSIPLPLAFCPRCGGYHFSDNRERLRELAALLAEMPPEKVVGE